MKSLLSTLLMASFLMLSGCKDDDKRLPDPQEEETGVTEIQIADIVGIPDYVSFNKVRVEIKGDCWDVIDVVEAPYIQGEPITLLLSAPSSSKLMRVLRSSDSDYCACWPISSLASNPDARVAELGDIIAYKDDFAVGRIYLTDWQDFSVGEKIYIYYHYADRGFTLSGSNKSYTYSADFKKGWNMYANILFVDPAPDPLNPPPLRANRCTTVIPEGTGLHWRFEFWKYEEDSEEV
ncbi:hypothetical protein D0T60_00285 [Bacteroides sp. 224]|nr:hypothetical protein [Bacteroides sp. 224]